MPVFHTKTIEAILDPVAQQSSNPVMEKRRRARIIESLSQLKSFILEATNKDVLSCCYNHRHVTTSGSAYMYIFIFILALTTPVSGNDNRKLITLSLGENATVPFSMQAPRGASRLHYIIRFESIGTPFCLNDVIDPHGLINEDQEERFRVSSSVKENEASVNLTIMDVRAHDEGIYVFYCGVSSAVYNISVYIPPGEPKCFIQYGGHRHRVHEIHCSASSGNGLATITCFQNGENMLQQNGIVRDGNSMSKVFWLFSVDTPFVCCSHDINEDISQIYCTGFSWPPPAIDSHTSTSSSDPLSTDGTSYKLTSSAPWHFVHHSTFLMMAILTLEEIT